ncbi:hypothetical protein HKD37_U059042 [Glycine soja]
MVDEPHSKDQSRASSQFLDHRRPFACTRSHGPQVRRGYPLSLSISISGEKRASKDSLSSSGEPGKATMKSVALGVQISNLEASSVGGPGPKSPGRGARGEPVVPDLSHHGAVGQVGVV